jgi:hypothetical protein
LVNSCPGPQVRFPVDVQLHRDLIRGLEADAPDITDQAVGVALDGFNRLLSIGLVNPECPRRRHTVAKQERHDFAEALLIVPGLLDSATSLRTNPLDGFQQRGLGLDHPKDVLPESGNQFGCVDRPDAADHTRAKIFLNAFHRVGGGRAEMSKPKLLAVLGVDNPIPLGVDPFPRGYGGRRPHGGDQVAMTANVQPKDGEPGLFTVEGDPFDLAGEMFLRGRRSYKVLWVPSQWG